MSAVKGSPKDAGLQPVFTPSPWPSAACWTMPTAFGGGSRKLVPSDEEAKFNYRHVCWSHKARSSGKFDEDHETVRKAKL